MRSFTARIALALLIPLPAFSAAPQAPSVADNYVRAAQVLDATLAGAVRNGSVTAHWIEGSRRFWYRRDAQGGIEYRIVDPEARTSEPAFDTRNLDAAMAASNGAPVRYTVVDIAPAGDRVQAELDDGRLAECWLLDLPRCTLRDALPINELPSPSGERTLYIAGHDLMLREATGARRLTQDGVAHYAYGKLPDASQRALATPAPVPVGVAWTPDGARVFGIRLDERPVTPYPFLESVPRDGSVRPKLHTLRLALLGEAPPAQEVFVIDVATGQKRVIDLGEGWRLHDADLGWSRDARRTWRIAHTAGWKSMALVEIDLVSARVRRIIEETAPRTSLLPHSMPFMPPNVRILEDSGEAIWFSERDGWGHLHLYDLGTGRHKRALTHGDWAVRDLIEVDHRHRVAFVTGTGREPGRDPYLRHLYRVPLDGGEPVLLTPEDAEHDIPTPSATLLPPSPGRRAFSADFSVFIDSWSTVDTPPVTVLRRADDGEIIMPLEVADTEAVQAAGWRAPRRVSALAADGVTELYATVWLPPGFSPESRYPVIHATYGGPWTLNAPRSYQEAVSTFNPVSRASLAELGFIVVTIDARGTRGRSRAFTDVGYGDFIGPAIEDHVAVIRQLAEQFGGFDLDRVGVYGHSFGGYVAARSLLTRPDFFKVAAASAGPHNYQGLYGMEHLLGLATDGTAADHYQHLDNAHLAHRLRGRLLLAYGDLDESAYPALTLQLAAALIQENKRFDLLYLPNRTHDFFRTDTYYTRRLWDHFVEHLQGIEPPSDVDLN
ncbi:prolyl oligopeptidase family serine peptidase [Luteimonas sp. S4-F44]|uniref:S9 family peptidase n=1 Tax=Luteimonas sp. S4-F44 TaxID=2925842 RepID=UPI001F5319CE|nr:prolyl oligopeptidase family serine peptidase [Luteimonas sp. S4-F44]UNK41221.1 prolyl oligopeptidase family serine peptidase [Luteimonas sp. S4-F44]